MLPNCPSKLPEHVLQKIREKNKDEDGIPPDLEWPYPLVWTV